MTKSLRNPAWVLACALFLGSCAGAFAAPVTGVAGVAGGPPVAAALAMAGAAAGLSGTVGCKFQGCDYGSYCNGATGLCEVKSCGKGCPVNTVCNEGLNRCQSPPPATPPTDYLPADRDWVNNNDLWMNGPN